MHTTMTTDATTDTSPSFTTDATNSSIKLTIKHNGIKITLPFLWDESSSFKVGDIVFQFRGMMTVHGQIHLIKIRLIYFHHILNTQRCSKTGKGVLKQNMMF